MSQMLQVVKAGAGLDLALRMADMTYILNPDLRGEIIDKIEEAVRLDQQQKQAQVQSEALQEQVVVKGQVETTNKIAENTAEAVAAVPVAMFPGFGLGWSPGLAAARANLLLEAGLNLGGLIEAGARSLSWRVGEALPLVDVLEGQVPGGVLKSLRELPFADWIRVFKMSQEDCYIIPCEVWAVGIAGGMQIGNIVEVATVMGERVKQVYIKIKQ